MAVRILVSSGSAAILMFAAATRPDRNDPLWLLGAFVFYGALTVIAWALRTPAEKAAMEDTLAHARATLRRHLRDLLPKHEGEWIAVHGDQILGVSRDRQELVMRFHRPEYIPVLITQIAAAAAKLPVPLGNEPVDPALDHWLEDVVSRAPKPPEKGEKVEVSDIHAAFDRLQSLKVPAPEKK